MCVRPTPLSPVYTDHYTRGPLHRLGRWAPLGGSMRPLRRASRPHHLVRGLGGVVRRGVPWCRAGALSHTFPVADGRRSGASTGRHPLVRRRGLRLWHHARIRLRDGQGAGGASARHQRADVAHPWTGRCRITLAPHGAAACSRRARFCLARRRAACWRSLGGKSSGVHIAPPRATRGWSGGCYVHAEWSRATSQGCGEVVDMRGSHNDATLASQSPPSTF